jgi:hypothetical protein
MSQDGEVNRIIMSLTALVQYESVARPMSSMSPKWKREVLRRLNLLDLKIDPIKRSQTYR